MSYHHSKPPVYFNNHRAPLPCNSVVNKNEKPEDLKLKQLARCCICFENYSLNTCAPVCGPCGHSFCTVCVRKLIFGNLICCCICRKVTFFGPKELGKNIQLLDILESLGLLDPDDKKTAHVAFSSTFPENVIEGVEDKDLVKFFEFCFDFVKKFYENKQETLITHIAMVTAEGHQEITRRANEMFFARTRLGDSLDKTLLRFNECLQTMNDQSQSTENARQQLFNYGGVDEFIPAMEDNYDDPFGLESASIHAFIALNGDHEIDFIRGFEGVETSTHTPSDDFESANDYNRANFPDDFDSSTDGFNRGNEAFRFDLRDDDEEFDDFHPGPWNPISKLFALPRARNNNRI